MTKILRILDISGNLGDPGKHGNDRDPGKPGDGGDTGNHGDMGTSFLFWSRNRHKPENLWAEETFFF